MNKRGQFFLIAALIIVVIIIGLWTVSIGTKFSKEGTRIFDLTNEIDLEGKSVVDHGVFTSTESETGTKIEQLFNYYAEANPESELTLIYGDPDGYTIVEKIIKEHTSCIGHSCQSTTTTETSSTSGSCTDPDNCEVSVNIDEDTTLDFDLSPVGQSFYIVIVDEEETTGERTVATN